MAKQYDKAVTIYAHEPSGYNIFELFYDTDFPNVGVSVAAKTNRITFDSRIKKIEVWDAGDIKRTVRKPFFGRIQIGVPPATPFPSEGIRISFDDVKKKHAFISGLRIVPQSAETK